MQPRASLQLLLEVSAAGVLLLLIIQTVFMVMEVNSYLNRGESYGPSATLGALFIIFFQIPALLIVGGLAFLIRLGRLSLTTRQMRGYMLAAMGCAGFLTIILLAFTRSTGLLTELTNGIFDGQPVMPFAEWLLAGIFLLGMTVNAGSWIRARRGTPP